MFYNKQINQTAITTWTFLSLKILFD
uniref:Uncharacterized protein n=1 Tax=Rhizophora mucronata TaxID=61149 RepID=A0A2P2R4Y9_RHIMU